MKALQKASKFLSDYTSVVVIAIAVVTFFVPAMMGWVNNPLFVDPVSNKFTCQSIIIVIIISCICTDESTSASGWNCTWSDPCRLLSGWCILQYHVLSVWRRCGIFRRNDYGIHNHFTGYDTAYGFTSCKRNAYYDQRTSDVCIYC